MKQNFLFEKVHNEDELPEITNLKNHSFLNSYTLRFSPPRNHQCLNKVHQLLYYFFT